MNIFRVGLLMLVLAPWTVQAQTAATASGGATSPQQAGAASGQQAPSQPGPQAAAPGSTHGAHGGHGGAGAPAGQGLRPQPAIIVDANALIRDGQRANAMEEAQSAPPPRLSTPARKKPGVHLSTSRPLPLSTEDAGKP